MSQLETEHDDGLAISLRESTDLLQPFLDLAAIASSLGLFLRSHPAGDASRVRPSLSAASPELADRPREGGP